MELGDVLWFLFILLWLFSGIVSRVVKSIRSRRKPSAAERQVTHRPGLPQTASARPVAARPAAARPVAPPPVPPGPSPRSPQDALSELLRQFGVDMQPAAEQPVPAEHRRTPAEHRRTATEARRSASEHDHSPGWHDRTVSEIRRTASETELVPSEHRLSVAEHVRGDLSTPRPAAAGRSPRAAAVAPDLARLVRADLGGDRQTLARAMVLREILGPPVGLRSEEER